MQPNPTELIKQIGSKTPLIGFYDAPDVAPFRPIVRPTPIKHTCIFTFYNSWLQGKTLHITKDNYGCGGCGNSIFGLTTRSREHYVKFLVDEEGLKASHELMYKWIDQKQQYKPEHQNILIGPLREDQYQHLKSITFFVNPDQLSLLIIGAHYNSAPGDATPIIAPFGSGCMELLPLFDDINIPQAIVGGTDIAMRQYLPPDILAFTATKPMFKQLCELDKRSFLYKRFWKDLKKARGLSTI